MRHKLVDMCLQKQRSEPSGGRAETVAKLKVAINGFGRIGRNFLRCWHGRKDSPLEVVVVNDSGGVKNVSYARNELGFGCSINYYNLHITHACVHLDICICRLRICSNMIPCWEHLKQM